MLGRRAAHEGRASQGELREIGRGVTPLCVVGLVWTCGGKAHGRWEMVKVVEGIRVSCVRKANQKLCLINTGCLNPMRKYEDEGLHVEGTGTGTGTLSTFVVAAQKPHPRSTVALPSVPFGHSFAKRKGSMLVVFLPRSIQVQNEWEKETKNGRRKDNETAREFKEEKGQNGRIGDHAWLKNRMYWLSGLSGRECLPTVGGLF